MIRLDGVSKVYRGDNGAIRALDDLSLTIDAGEFVAVRGPSGSGKSTLLTLIAGLGTPTSGAVFVDGNNLKELSGSARTKFRSARIGFVFQMFHLIPYLSVLDNVLVPALSGQRAEKRKRAEELLDRFQLSDRIGHLPEQLSTGERQRVAIARALINDPQIILADEPTGNLDPENAARVLELLGQFHQAGGTVLIVTHEEQAAGAAQRTISLRSGKVESNGHPQSNTPKPAPPKPEAPPE